MTRPYRFFTNHDIKYLRENVGVKTYEQIASVLNRNIGSLKDFARKQGIRVYKAKM